MQTPEEPKGNEFNRIVEEIDKLEVDPERHVALQLDEQVRAIVRAAKGSGKKATLTIKVVAAPQPDRRIQFAIMHAATLPKPPSSAITLYADEDGALFRSDPMQIKLPGFDRPRSAPAREKAPSVSEAVEAAFGEGKPKAKPRPHKAVAASVVGKGAPQADRRMASAADDSDDDDQVVDE